MCEGLSDEIVADEVPFRACGGLQYNQPRRNPIGDRPEECRGRTGESYLFHKEGVLFLYGLGWKELDRDRGFCDAYRDPASRAGPAGGDLWVGAGSPRSGSNGCTEVYCL